MHVKFLVMLLFITTAIVMNSQIVRSQTQFSPPAALQITHYRLSPIDGTRLDVQCERGDVHFGCTAYCDPALPNHAGRCSEDKNFGYPHDGPSITVGIEGDINQARLDNVQHGYLHNVVPRETSPDFIHEVAVNAQAIAARTYAYWQNDFFKEFQVNPINNSASGFQVYIPYAYDALTPNNKTIIDDAVSPRHYLSYAKGPYTADITVNGQRYLFERGLDEPIFAEFNSESVIRTIGHPSNPTSYPYISGVPDPISSHPQLNQSYQTHGFIQRGASRWANGNLAFDKDDDKGVWAVKWQESAQILTHYYTGIHIRDANANNAIQTPEYRWNPLSIEWLPLGAATKEVDSSKPSVCSGSSYKVIVQIQNSESVEWPGPKAETIDFEIYDATIAAANVSVTTDNSNGSSGGVQPGSVVTFTTTYDAPNIIGSSESRTLRTDLFFITAAGPPYQPFHLQSPQWIPYDIPITVSKCTPTFLPVILSQ